MQVINQIGEKTKSSTKIQTIANIFLRDITSFSQAPTISNNNISFLYLFNFLQGSITFTSRNLDVKIPQLIKEGKYFNGKEKRYKILHDLEKTKVLVITNALNIDDFQNVN